MYVCARSSGSHFYTIIVSIILTSSRLASRGESVKEVGLLQSFIDLPQSRESLFSFLFFNFVDVGKCFNVES